MTFFIRFVSVLSALGILASGCTETVAACDDPTHVRAADGTCGPVDGTDAGNDAGGDAGEDVDAGRDAGIDACGGCAGALPLCRDSDTSCVECLGNTDCASNMCDTGPGRCVDCTTSANCSEVDAPTCTTGACVSGCDDALCAANFPSTPACDEDVGTCRACMPSSEGDDCGANSCNPGTFECTTTERGSQIACQDCVSDSDCEPLTIGTVTAALRCVPGGWGDLFATPTGNHCMLDLQELPIGMRFCPNGFPEQRTLTSVGGGGDPGVTSDYCHPSELTTCQALTSLRFRMSGDCDAGTVVDACGIPGQMDGTCLSTRCSVPCSIDMSRSECVAGRCDGTTCV